MKYIWSILILVSIILVTALFIWIRYMPVPESFSMVRNNQENEPSDDLNQVIYIGLIPERNIFAQQKRYKVIADYLSSKLGLPVELITVNTYDSIFYDFENNEIDLAFLGSLVALLSIDRYGAEVVLKPELENGISSYHGVIFSRSDSPINSVEDLAGKTIAMLRTTMAGHLFPIHELVTHGVWHSVPARPRIEWLGTHDEIISAVASGIVDAGAAKNLNLDIYESHNPGVTFNRFAVSEEVPNNALLIRKGVSNELKSSVIKILLEMPENQEGIDALRKFGVRKFIPCSVSEFQAIYRMIDPLRKIWDDTGIGGEIPSSQSEGN